MTEYQDIYSEPLINTIDNLPFNDPEKTTKEEFIRIIIEYYVDYDFEKHITIQEYLKKLSRIFKCIKESEINKYI